MRWLMVVSSLDASDGGPPRAVLGLSSALARAGHDVCIVTHDHQDVIHDETTGGAQADGVRIVWVPRRRATRFQLSPRLLAAARREARRADVVTCHGFYQFTCVAALLASRAAGRPLMLQPHGVFEPYQERESARLKTLFRRLVGDRVLAGTKAIVAASQSEVVGIETSLGPASPPIILAGLGVDAVSDELRDLDRFHTRSVLYLSRIAPKKRLDRLLRAADILTERGSPVSVTVCGDGDPTFVDELRRSVGPHSTVRWEGHVSGHAREAIEAAHALLCLPSDSENFGQAVTEAMARGLPVVTTTATGASEHVIRAGAGWVLASPTPTELADCLDTALADPTVLAAKAALGIDYARRELTWESVAQRWSDSAARLAQG